MRLFLWGILYFLLVLVARSKSQGKEGNGKHKFMRKLRSSSYSSLSGPVVLTDGFFIDLSFQMAGDSHRHPPAEQRQRGGGVAVSGTHDWGGEEQSG